MLCMVVLFCHVGSGFSAIVGDAALERMIHAAHAQSLDPYNRHIVVDDFGVGSAVEMTYMSPSKGRVTLNLMDETEENIMLHVDARYKWSYYVDTLIVNYHKKGKGWILSERLTPEGFDFTPGMLVTVRVEAEADKYIIYCNDREIAQYEHRLPVTSVKKVQAVFEDNNAEQKAELRSLAFYFR